MSLMEPRPPWSGTASRATGESHALVSREERSWLVVERLPACAPELHPVEALWGNLKRPELANLMVDTVVETESAARRGIERVRNETDLAFAFLRHTGLSL
jgi:transposase